MNIWLEFVACILLCPVFIGLVWSIMRLLPLIALLSTLSIQAAPPAFPAKKIETRELESTNRVLLLKAKKGINEATAESLPTALGLKKEKNPSKLKQWHVFSIPPGKNKREIIDLLERSGRFDKVQEPKIYKTQDTIPNDPMFPQLWGMSNIMAPQGWDIVKDAPAIVVAVVDTGIDFNHPDLKDNLWVGPQGEHGYVATNGVVIPGGFDDHGHGTHCAGTVGGVGNNGVGVVGVAWKTKIMAIKVLHHGSGNSIDIVNGYEKMVELKESGVPLLVSNHSYGGSGLDEYMQDGFQLLAEADIFAAVAAGNSAQNIDIFPFHPASYAFDNMVVAQALESSGNKAGFSCFGIVSTDISAPGVGIWSTTRSNTYSAFSGTSMAAPHVAGLACLVRQLNPTLTANQTREVILHPNSYNAGNFFSSTGAKINLFKTVNNPKIFENPFITNKLPKIISVTSYTVIKDTKPVLIEALGNDPEGDILKWSTSLTGLDSVFERRIFRDSLFISNINNLTVVAGGPFAYQMANQLIIGASDGRGGSATTNSGFEFVRDISFRKPISLKTWTAVPSSNSLVYITVDVDDVAKTNYAYGVMINYPGGNISGFWANNPSPSPLPYILNNNASNFSVKVFMMDRWLNWLVTDTIAYRTNGIESLPKIVVTVNTNEGNVPLNVTFDMSKSERVRHYSVFDLFWPSGSGGSGPVQNLQFTTPAMYFKMPLIYDTNFNEIDFTVVPIFASKFLGVIEQPKAINLAIQKSFDINGPWITYTNFADILGNSNQFYRLQPE